MTDREKLIDIIEYYADFLDWDRKEDMVDSIMEKGFATDNNVGDKMTPTWIPVTERLPEENKLVLAVCKSGKMFVGDCWNCYGTIIWRIKTARDSTKNIMQIVTHWMPLPEPPNEDSL